MGNPKRNAFYATAASLVPSSASAYSTVALEARGDARSGVLLLESRGSPLQLELERVPVTCGSRFVVHGLNRQINVILAAITKFRLQAPEAANAPISIFLNWPSCQF